MISRFHAADRHAATRMAAIAVATLALLLSGCGKKEKGASQTAAKVNKEEITVHQINFVLQQQRGLKPEQVDAASKQVLERLIDQELAVQKAEDLKLDRDPRVVQQIEATRREIIARAYAEKTGEAAPKPTPEEVKKYYDDHPALFKERRIYSLQEISVEAKPEQVAALREQLQSSKSVSEFVDFLKANNYRFAGNQAVRPAEQLPLNLLDTFSKLKDGQALLVPASNGAQVIVLVGSRSEPIDEARAKPAVEQFLLNDAKRKLVENDLKALRAAAKIEYVGKFAEAASAPTDTASAPVAVAAPPAPAPAAAASAGSLDASAISKGMGLGK
ncbi:MAG: EpsD family peptidyl-prolyl cis-trans isomerase [Proteobacteria bacterium]|nr:EpsD family peptidyl-prolyl cis-trans isomerase [Pseudomonadota bacterium]